MSVLDEQIYFLAKSSADGVETKQGKSAKHTEMEKSVMTWNGSERKANVTSSKWVPRQKIQRDSRIQSDRLRVFQYNICNGLSNQLLYHAASIAAAIQEDYDIVEIPNYFIVNGVQETKDDVLPNLANSVDFDVAFNASHFLAEIEMLGIEPRLVNFNLHAEDGNAPHQPTCAGMPSLQGKHPDLVLQIMKSFRPSEALQNVIDKITAYIGDDKDVFQSGVCVHHRDGKDWRDHCRRWTSLSKTDGIYRGNCLGPGRLKDSLLARILDDGPHWVYYCGDFERIPYLLQNDFKYQVVTRHSLLSDDTKAIIQNMKPGQPVRDLWALVDFSVCRNLDRFVGNSVSTFSAIQIALRQGEKVYWYNSQSIPLGDFWRVYQLPIVYTYTELSAASGKHLLQASIASVRKQMPKNPIHILYHGSSDVKFYFWLKKQGVTIHRHDPAWAEVIEEMRKNGDPSYSHLFLHPGNYLGTWQRIDIPLFLDSEYILLLDSDSIVNRPFTLNDFGKRLTRSIAMSSEVLIEDIPTNAGVTLMNVPYLRRTYNDFVKFVTSHAHSPRFDNQGPSDQGAYLEYYKPRFLSRCFNFKPYYKFSDIECAEPYIVHFHGAKPHDYLTHIEGDPCDSAFVHLCDKALHSRPLCASFQAFARASQSVDEFSYCNNTMPGRHVEFCSRIMQTLAEQEEECSDVTLVADTVRESLPFQL